MAQKNFNQISKLPHIQDSEVSKWVEIDEMTGKIHTKRYIDPRKVKEVKLYISMHKGKREIPGNSDKNSLSNIVGAYRAAKNFSIISQVFMADSLTFSGLIFR